ncbi:MAG: hypothetical protein LQ340_004284, partial [Diploschistes diacapsis]
MADPLTEQDSPLSITVSVAGILTFIYALAASIIGYIYLFHSSFPDSIERFYEAFSACALETDLVRRVILQAERAGDAARLPQATPDSTSILSKKLEVNSSPLSASLRSHVDPHLEEAFCGASSPVPKTDNYLLGPDSLGRLYEQVRAVEIELQNQATRVVRAGPTEDSHDLWDRLDGRGRWATGAKELEESLAKRQQPTARLLAIQMSLVSARTRTLVGTVQKMQERIDANEGEIREFKGNIAKTDQDRLISGAGLMVP